MQRGEVLRARAGFVKLVKLIPDSAAVWYNLGLCRSHLGEHREAIVAYQNALRIAPNHTDAMVNLGLSQKEQQPEAAMQSARAALKLQPQHPRALNLLGTLYADADELDQAQATFQQALEVAPGNVDARQNLANALLQSGDAKVALEIIRPLLNANASKRARLLHGQILLELKKYGEAAQVARALREEFNRDAEVLLLQMSVYEVARDYFAVLDIARELLDARYAAEIDAARVWNSMGSAYFQLDGVARATECYKEAVARDPEHAEYQNNLGLAYSAHGRKDEAEECYRNALARRADYAEAYRNLVAMKKFTDLEDADAQRMEKLWARDDLDDRTRTKLAFALGKVYDDVGHYKRAFETYAVGNRLKFAEAEMDFDKYFAHMDRVAEVFTAPPKNVSAAEVSPRPIFILGMPRSGTTLAEQIICRHSRVSGCGELPCIEKAIARLEKRAQPMRAYPQDFVNLDAQTFAAETHQYLAWVKRLHDLSTDFFTDKMPFNFVHLWLIKALFPTARIIHCHRHPLDVILSNYFQLYASDIAFVYELETLARYYARYYRLMRHWHRVFQGGIYKLQYEKLVGDRENETRALIAAAGLQWEDGCLDLTKSATAVRTASIWQVRMGVYTSSRARWRNYKEELAPAAAVLRHEQILDAEYNEIP